MAVSRDAAAASRQCSQLLGTGKSEAEVETRQKACAFDLLTTAYAIETLLVHIELLKVRYTDLINI